MEDDKAAPAADEAETPAPAGDAPAADAAAPTDSIVGNKSKKTAIFLCGGLGFFGMHRFYLGYWGIGLIQLFSMGGLGLWMFIDLFLLLTGKLKDSKGKDLDKNKSIIDFLELFS